MCRFKTIDDCLDPKRMIIILVCTLRNFDVAKHAEHYKSLAHAPFTNIDRQALHLFIGQRPFESVRVVNPDTLYECRNVLATRRCVSQ